MKCYNQMSGICISLGNNRPTSHQQQHSEVLNTSNDLYNKALQMPVTESLFFATVDCCTDMLVKEIPCFQFIHVEHEFQYCGYCDDFGPMNLATVFRFCELLAEKLLAGPVVIMSSNRPEDVTNALFLTGSYLIMKLNYDLPAVSERMHRLLAWVIPFRDVSGSAQTFDLNIEDCWGGLLRAKNLAWVDFGQDGFDVEEYEHFDHPLQADMHEVVPGKFVAMKGPIAAPRTLAVGAVGRTRCAPTGPSATATSALLTTPRRCDSSACARWFGSTRPPTPRRASSGPGSRWRIWPFPTARRRPCTSSPSSYCSPRSCRAPSPSTATQVWAAPAPSSRST